MVDKQNRIPGRARGRPALSDADRAQTRARIEAQAQALFRAEGYAAVSMRRLAQEIGCSPMTLYGYFENKIDILRALWAQIFRDLFAGLERSLDAAHAPAERLRRLSVGYVEYWLEHPDHYRLVFMVDGVTEPEVRAFVGGAEIAERISLFRALVTAAAPSRLTPEETGLRVDFLLSALHGVAHCQLTMSGHDWTGACRLAEFAVAASIAAE